MKIIISFWRFVPLCYIYAHRRSSFLKRKVRKIKEINQRFEKAPCDWGKFHARRRINGPKQTDDENSLFSKQTRKPILQLKRLSVPWIAQYEWENEKAAWQRRKKCLGPKLNEFWRARGKDWKWVWLWSRWTRPRDGVEPWWGWVMAIGVVSAWLDG